MMSSDLRVCVIGAGVVGLSTATLFQDRFPSAKITVAAEKFETETTSDGAAGLFRPGLSFMGPSREITLKWLKDSYAFYDDFLVNYAEEAHLAGIRRISGYLLSSEDPEIPKNWYLRNIIEDFRSCTPAELLDFPGAKYGSHCTTVLTECRRYLPYLTAKFKSKGGVVVKWKIHSFEDLVKDFDLVFNCSGLGAKYLCNDHHLDPIRGQVVKVNAPWVDKFVYMDYNTYIIPGIEAVTLGGKREFGSLKKEVDKFDRASIMDGCTKVLPFLKHAKVLREWVGFRPHRGCVRVESEVLRLEGLKSLKVVHNYGHGGYGVMSAPGTSMAAVELAADLLKSGRSKL